MGVETDGHIGTLGKVATKPLDLVGVNVRRSHLYRRRQIDDHVPIRAHAPGLSHGRADLYGKIEFRSREALRGILEDNLRFRDARHLPFHQLHPLQGEIDDLLAGLPKDHPALKRAGGVIKVEDGPLGPRNGVYGADDEFFPGLAEHLNGDGLGDPVLRDDLANEIKIRLRGCGKAHLNFLEAEG